MNQVKRAIIMAAGKGTRMQPVTLETPKSLIKVNGVRIIDTIIDALHENKIHEIYIVVGYLKEKFEILKDKYENIKLVENPYYDSCNNISSLYIARDYISNAIIIDGDQVIYNPEILNRDFEKSGYNCIWTDGNTQEWLLNLKDGIVESCSRTGGEKGWQLFSVSRWSEKDGEKLKKHLEIEFEENKNTQIYWDDVVLFCHLKEYKLGIRKIRLEDIKEIDNFEELIELDKSYEKYLKK